MISIPKIILLNLKSIKNILSILSSDLSKIKILLQSSLTPYICKEKLLKSHKIDLF